MKFVKKSFFIHVLVSLWFFGLTYEFIGPTGDLVKPFGFFATLFGLFLGSYFWFKNRGRLNFTKDFFNNIWLLFFLIFLYINIFFASHINYDTYLINLILLYFLYLLTANYLSFLFTTRFLEIIQYLRTPLLLLALVGVVSYFFPIETNYLVLKTDDEGRMDGWLTSSNGFVTWIGLGLILEVWLVVKRKSLFTLVSIAFIFLFALALFLSGSRGGMLSFGLVLVVFSFRNLKFFFGTRGLAFFLTIALIGVLFGNLIFQTFSIVDKWNIITEKSELQSMEKDERLNIWDNTFENWRKLELHQKVLGIGRGGGILLANRSTHNGFITGFVEKGFVFLIYLLILSRSILKVILSKPNKSMTELLFFFSLFIIFRSATNNGIGNIGFNVILIDIFIILSSKRIKYENIIHSR